MGAMLLFPECKIASAWNAQASFVAVETVMKTAPRMTPVSRPVVTQRLGSGDIVRNGWTFIDWRWNILRWTYLNAFVTTYLGAWTTDSANATVRTLKAAHTYGNYNVKLYLPTFQGDEEFGGYEEPALVTLTNVHVRMLVRAAI